MLSTYYVDHEITSSKLFETKENETPIVFGPVAQQSTAVVEQDNLNRRSKQIVNICIQPIKLY